MHYASKEEAYEKWNRRKKRINWDKILLKLSEREGISEEQLRNFPKSPYNKVINTQKKYKNIYGMIYTSGLEKTDKIGMSEVGLTLKASNIVKLMNSI